MYYYGGYSQGGNQGCGCNSSYTGGYNYPTYGGYGYGGYGNGYGSGAAIVLVLFILLVIIIGCRNFVTV
jgi:hypothetical protein